jgi:hypothetical protein
MRRVHALIPSLSWRSVEFLPRFQMLTPIIYSTDIVIIHSMSRNLEVSRALLLEHALGIIFLSNSRHQPNLPLPIAGNGILPRRGVIQVPEFDGAAHLLARRIDFGDQGFRSLLDGLVIFFPRPVVREMEQNGGGLEF